LKRRKLTKEVRISNIVIRYNRVIEDHISKHNIKIKDIVRCFETDYLLKKIGRKNWLVISKHPDSGRMITIFLEQIRGLEFRLKTARDSNEAEKRLYKKKVK